MWDVKTTSSLKSSKLSWFYLNYVGCKAKNQFHLLHLSSRFTLTMWDVKRMNEPGKIMVSHGFTLTMWDVKY